METIAKLLKTGTIIFSDAEYINENLLGGRPLEHHYKEVTQIGAVKYVDGKLVDSFNMMVRPSIKGDKLSDEEWKKYYEITGIKKETVMNCPNDFKYVWSEYMKFVDNNVIVIMLGDREVYKWNFKLLGENKNDLLDKMNFIILKPLLDDKYKKYCSGQLFSLVGTDEERNLLFGDGTIHDALFDSKSMAYFLTHLLQ